jgi:hypothetical protein
MKQALSPEKARVRRGQFRALTLGVGASALAMACSFGEIDGQEEIKPVDLNPANTPSEQPVDEPTVIDGSGGPSNPGVPVAQPGDDAPTAYDGEDPFQSVLGQEVKAIIEANCAQCHAGGSALGGMNYILNLQSLITNGKVIPGNKEDSQLFVRMQQQSMPPAYIRDQRPTYGQIDQVGLFIDELDPTVLGNTPAACNPLSFMDHDAQVAAMAQDIQNVDTEDQPFTRYLTVTYSSNAGDCERAVQRQRYALFKGINSVSTEAQIGIPKPIDQNETIYRIDIRDYNWDRDIDLEDDGIVDFNDGWDALVDGVGEYAVEYTGDDADDLKADAATAVPFMPVNAFVQFSEQNDLYYTLIGARANLFVFEEQVLGINTAEEILDNNLLRAGFSNSGVSKQERVLNRFDQNTAGGFAYWISFDFDNDVGANESIYQDPLGFAFAGGEAIFNLPNGMQAYYVANAKGDRLGEAPVGVVIDPAQNNGVVVNGASCHSCHNAGMITFTDTVRQYVVENRIEFDNNTYEDVLEQYVDANTFKRAMDADSELHVSRVEQAGVPRTAPDPVTRVFLDFQLGNIDLRMAAGELNVTEKELKDNLQQLSPTLVNLGNEGGYVDRDIFTNAYVDALCVLHNVNENIPANCP